MQKSIRVARGLYQCRAYGWAMNTDLNSATNLLNKYPQAWGQPGRVVLAPLAVPVIRLLEERKRHEAISKSPPTAIRPAMGESPVLQ